MNVEIYAMAPFSLVLILFDFSLVFALLCPLSGITFIDTSLQNSQIFICLHHIEILVESFKSFPKMRSCDCNLAINDGERTPLTAVSATWIHKGVIQV